MKVKAVFALEVSSRIALVSLEPFNQRVYILSIPTDYNSKCTHGNRTRWDWKGRHVKDLLKVLKHFYY